MKIITSKSKLNKIRLAHGINEEDFSEVTGAKIQGNNNDNHGTQVYLTEDKNPKDKNAEYDLIDYWM